MVLKAQLFALTGVQPHRQKVMCKGVALKDDEWNFQLKDVSFVDSAFRNFKHSMRIYFYSGCINIATWHKRRDFWFWANRTSKIHRRYEWSGTCFCRKCFENVQNYWPIELFFGTFFKFQLKLPPGLTNLGNTCYMNATVQCLKSVPELRDALKEYKEDFSISSLASAQSITAAMRSVFDQLNGGNTVTPVLLLQTLHMAFPQFAQTGEKGSYKQQDANECWSELLKMLQQKLKPMKNGELASSYK